MNEHSDRPSLARIAFEAWWAADERWTNVRPRWELLTQQDAACWEAVAQAVSGALVREDRLDIEELRERYETLAAQWESAADDSDPHSARIFMDCAAALRALFGEVEVHVTFERKP